MASYKYTARERTGGQVTGVLAAETVQDVARQLRERSLFPVKVEQSFDLKDVAARTRSRRVKPRVLAKFYSQFADLLRSGVPLLRALQLLRKQSSNQALAEILDDITKQVADGVSTADAMKAHERTFGELAVSMVRAGQEGGFLEDVFKRIAVFTERQEELRAKVVGALAYPVMLLLIGFSVVGLLIVYFVPKFERIFDRLRERGELPAATEFLLAFSALLQSYGLWILGAFAVAIYFARMQLSTPEGKRWFDGVKLKAPLFGPVFRDLAITRFNRILGTLRRNGVPILASLKIAKDSTGNELMREAIDKAAENVKQGDKLATPLRLSKVFPPDVVEMIEVAEESNNLENVLIESADSLEAQTTRQLELAVRFLEPLMLLVMAAVTLVVVLALMLPIFKMSSAMSG
jgi:general secretion pathway protein F